jgi:hypothetical protein
MCLLGMIGVNALAYNTSVNDEEVFFNAKTRGPNVSKLFTASFTFVRDKLKCWSLASFSNLV